MNNGLFNFFRPRKNIGPSDVRPGHEILCSDGKAREVDVLDYTRRSEGVYRFMFTDDHWIEYTTGKRVTVLC